MGKNTIAISVLADTKALQKGFSDADGAFNKFAKSAALVGVAVAGIGVAIGVKAVKSASELEQAMGGMEAVFKDQAGMMTEWANKAASSVGLAKSEYANLATVLGSQLKNMGIPFDQLGQKTNELVGLGADLAAQFGGSTADAVGALSALLRGERDPIERYGVSLKQADINARLAEKGLSGLTGEALKQATTMATLELLYEQTADAQGAFSRESTTLAGAQQRLAAGTENLYATLGTALLPAVTAVTAAFGSMINTVQESAGFQALTGNLTAASNAFADFVFSILNGEGAFAGLDIAGALQVAVNQAIGFLGTQGVQGIAEGFLAIRSGITTALFAIAEGVTQNMPAILQTVTELIVQIASSFVDMAPYAMTAGIALITALADSISGTLPNVVAQILTLLPQLVSAITFMAPTLLAAGINLILTLVNAVTTALPQIITALVGILPSLISTIVGMVPTLLAGAITLFQSLIQAIVVILPQLVTQLLGMLPGLVGSLLSMVPMILQAAITLFTSLVQALPVILPQLITAIVNTLPVLIGTILGMLPGILEAAIQLFTALVQSIPVILPLLITAILNLLPTLVSTVVGMIPQLIDAAIQLFTGLVTAIPQIIPQLITAIIGLAPQIVGTILGLIPQLVSAGVNLIGGLVRGLLSAAGTVGRVLLDIAQRAVGSFLAFFGIKSPSRLFMKFGGYMIQGLSKGITGSTGLLTKAMGVVNSTVADGWGGTLTAGRMSLSADGAASARGVVYNVTVNALNATADTGRMIVESVKEYQAVGGRQTVSFA